MDKTVFDNHLRRQCMSLPQLCADQIAGVRQGLEEAGLKEKLKGIRRVIITGCGDSYVAAKAAVPAFRAFDKRFGSGFTYARAIDAARYITMSEREASATLLIGVSCSGGPARIQEVLARGNKYGYMTLALTNNPESPAAKEAKHSLIVHTPAFPNANPGLRNYYASLTGLYMLAATLGEAVGASKPGTVDALAQAIAEYTAKWTDLLEPMDDQMFRLAQTWKDFNAFDCIGDDIQFSTAFFIGAKIVEVAGRMTQTDDSEDWCHVGFFQRDPHHIGTFIVADKKDNNVSRIAETVSQAAGVGRPILFIANGSKEEFGITADIELCQIPETPAGYEFLLPLMNYVPGAILAGYISTLGGETFFRGPGVWSQPGNNTIRSSKLEII